MSETEVRKIQFTGKSSYIVSLPKQWILDLGLKQGDQVTIKRSGTSLQIISSLHRTKDPHIEDAIFEISNNDENGSIIRRIISLYFIGFKTISIRPKTGRFMPAQRTAIKDAVKKMLIGTEIISDSTNEIIIQVLVNLLELSIDGAFKRMVHLAKSMLNDVLLVIKETNLDLANEIIKTDDEVDKFGFYIIRQLKIAIQNEQILHDMGFSNPRNCLGYRLITKNIERIADHVVMIANGMIEFNSSIQKEIYFKINEMVNFTLNLIDQACLSLFKEDFNHAETTIKNTTKIIQLEKNVLNVIKFTNNDEEIYFLRRVIENIRRIAEYASDIAEIVLNINIEKIIKKKKNNL